ncbi:MAG: tartrate dehydrogenase/decarboxylase/D-malate dehydrogenase [Psychromonas sp.]
MIRSKYQKDIDFIIIRENNEGEFKKNGKILHPNEPYGLAIDISLFIRAGLTGIAHFSFKLAQKRRKQMTNVTKSNTRINTLYYCYIVI